MNFPLVGRSLKQSRAFDPLSSIFLRTAFMMIVSATTALLLLSVACTLVTAVAPNAPPQMGFACELPTPYLSKYFTNETFEYLEKMDATVVLATIDLSEERAQLVQQLTARGIKAMIWIILHHDQGYWMNMDNVDNATKRYQEIRQWIAKYDLKVEGIGFDMELDWRNVQEIADHKWMLLLEWTVSRFRADALAYAKQKYSELADSIRSDGYKVLSFTLPLIYDERKVNSTFLQRLTGIVDVQNVDIEVPMLYTTAFPFGLGVLESYFNISSYVGIGITGGLNSQGGGNYANWTMFQYDLLFAYQRGAKFLGIYSLEGCIDNNYLPNIISMDWSTPLPPQMSKLYDMEAGAVNENRLSLEGLLYATVNPFDATAWAALHPIEVFDHLYEFLKDWYEWRSGVIPN